MQAKTIMHLIQQKNIRRKFIISAFLLICIFLSENWVESVVEHRYQQDEKVETLQRLSVVRAKLETILNNNLSLLKGMSIAIASNPKLDQVAFDRYAREILRTETLLINLAGAPDMVVSFVYPIKGNEKIIGLDYFRNKYQREEALKVRDSRSVVIAGPVDLIQGGRAFIGRAPIFYFDETTQKERFWGILSAPMKIDRVLSAAGFLELEKQQPIALRKKSTDKRAKKMIYGTSEVFSESAVITEISVAGETWELGAIIRLNPEGLAEITRYIRLAFTLFGLLIAVIVILTWRRSYERNRLIEQLTYREGILERVGSLASVGGWEYHSSKGFTFLSNEIYNLVELPKSEGCLTPDKLLAMVDQSYHQELREAIDSLLNDAQQIDLELPILSAKGTEKWIRIQAHIQGDFPGEQTIQGVVQDISERIENTKIIQHQANYDPLTKLANRTLFDEKLEYTVANAKRSQKMFGLLYIDLDRFKLINDSLGHSIGDKLLIEVSTRLLSCIRESDTLSRRSGDEFTLIVNQLHHKNSVELVAKNILQELKAAFYIEGNQIYIGASIGITIFPSDGDSAGVLIKNADQGMYSAKSKGRSTFSYFTSQMQVSSDRRLRLHIDMIDALDKNLFEVYYQPIINLHSGAIVECEALIRWQHPDLGAIPAEELITLAEDVGLIGKLGNFVMCQALSDINELNDKYNSDIGVAINKSYREFISADEQDPQWIMQLKNAGRRTRITVEITESLLIENDEIYQMLEQLRSAGITISIDDFGTGYSSLSYLRRFPIDQLKIDRSFIKDIDTDKDDLALVDIILAMADNLGFKVVAEGVENAAQLALLSQRNCDFCQGYHIAKPMPKVELERWLEGAVLPHS
ncbi:MAG: EAL domain-containing protein [Pseudomonadales bacterium]|nr:EAL domain-containing protein [Pseudomonadales bacterium]